MMVNKMNIIVFTPRENVFNESQDHSLFHKDHCKTYELKGEHSLYGHIVYDYEEKARNIINLDSPKNFIWQINKGKKNRLIFAYPCLEDEQAKSENFFKNFIYYILNDISVMMGFSELEELFQHKLYLLLHDRDIGLLDKNDHRLSEQEIGSYLLERNSDLKKYFPRDSQDRFSNLEVYVFKHIDGNILSLINEFDWGRFKDNYDGIDEYILDVLACL